MINEQVENDKTFCIFEIIITILIIIMMIFSIYFIYEYYFLFIFIPVSILFLFYIWFGYFSEKVKPKTQKHKDFEMIPKKYKIK